MFVKSIESTSRYTRPIHTISRTYGSKKVIPGAGTLFFINEEGYAITCKHVIEIFKSSTALNRKFKRFQKERESIESRSSEALQKLEKKYGFNPDVLCQQNYNLIGCVEKMSGFTVLEHKEFDLAVIKFNDFTKKLYTGHAIFKKDTKKIKQGKFLCRLGFPFPEFNNFKYDDAKEELVWTSNGMRTSPIFPLEGMITRFVMSKGVKMGIELSTPGLRGQSGGPLFDENGLVYGMQSRTKHLHLGFDIENLEVRSKGKVKKVNDYSFIHLGECIHVDIIKNFLNEKGIKFYEE